MTQNIYWCEEKGEQGGLFVIAQTRGKARQLYAEYIECRYIDVRTSLMRRGVNEDFSCIISNPNSALLKKYKLEYQEAEE